MVVAVRPPPQKSATPQIRVLPLDTIQSKDILSHPRDLGFGRHFTDRMFMVDYEDGKWKEASIKKLESLALHPATSVFHYAQAIFEGMKAFRQVNGRVVLFRPDRNVARFNETAERMCMPQIDPLLFLEGLKRLVSLEKDWVPSGDDCSLYIRPTYIATDPVLGVRPSSKCSFFIILSPSGPYFKDGFKPIKIFVTDKFVRAAPGGVGGVKAAANYAPSLKAMEEAAKYGAPQVLWLDAIKRKYIEEVGSMNVFIVKDGIAHTAPLKGTILPGVTRESVLTICTDLGIPAAEKPLTITSVIQGIRDGSVTEIFGAGTAAVIAPIGELIYKEKELVVNDFKTGEISARLYNYFNDLRRGTIPDHHGWIVSVDT